MLVTISIKYSFYNIIWVTFLQNQSNSNIIRNGIENKNTTITSYLTNKISNTISIRSQAVSGESRKHSQSRGILSSPSKTNKKVPKKSADPDDFVLV